MGWKEKHIYGEAGVGNLVLGILLVIIALLIIVYMYAYVSGLEASGEGMLVLRDISGLTMLNLGTLFFGVVGGFEIGRYVQTEFTKRRKQSSSI